MDVVFVESVFTFWFGLGLFVFSAWKKDALLSKDAWSKLLNNIVYAKLVLTLGIISMIVYFGAEYSNLQTIEGSSGHLESLHHIGEAVHMFLIAFALILVALILRTMVGDEDTS